MAVKGCGDGVYTVSTADVEPGQQHRQRAVGLPPHQAVDGLQCRVDMGERRKILRLYRAVAGR